MACSYQGDDAVGAPRVLALPTPILTGPPEVTRAAARQLARQALVAELAEALSCNARDIVLSSRRGVAPRATWHADAARDPCRSAWLAKVGLSISHAPGCSLAAWRADGAVGVDVQTRPGRSDMSADELQRVAKLYLGPDSWPNLPPALVDVAQYAALNIAFVNQWAAHEARLKCLGESLQEWSPMLQARLAACVARPLRLPIALATTEATHWVAAVAWPRAD